MNDQVSCEHTADVVSNDKKIAIDTPASIPLADYLKKAPSPEAIGAYIQDVAKEGAVWEQSSYRTSQRQLYEWLKKPRQFCERWKSTETPKETRKNMDSALTDFLRLKGIKTHDDTHYTLRVVKAFCCDMTANRQRFSAWAGVLRVAITEGISAADMPDWIERNGGIEEIRRGRPAKGLTVSERADSVKDKIAAQTQMTIEPNGDLLFGDADLDRQCLLIATYDSKGKLRINDVVRNATAVKFALAAWEAERRVK
jgi:hypothetical protein